MKFDKYKLYTEAVQSPDYDAGFLRTLYRKISGDQPKMLREDFCGTHTLAQAWVMLGSDMRASGVDIDPEAIAYGASRCQMELSQAQRARLKIIEGDVLKSPLPKADVACAFNFSYFCFHSRKTLVSYFTRVHRSLKPKGIFVVDIFGGPEHGESSIENRRLPGFRYSFEQDSFDPISNRARFHIHLQPRGGRMHKRVFTYDWRMWSIPEVRDAMSDAGFKNTLVYWEGTGRNGRGSGRYYRREKGDPCQVWTAYVIGER